MTGCRCLYCGSGEPWWDCSCFRVVEVREGKRAKPKVLRRNDRLVIVLDVEAAAVNALGFEVYRPPEVNISDEETVNSDPEGVAGVNAAADRTVYMREYMRKKREADRLAREGVDEEEKAGG